LLTSYHIPLKRANTPEKGLRGGKATANCLGSCSKVVHFLKDTFTPPPCPLPVEGGRIVRPYGRTGRKGQGQASPLRGFWRWRPKAASAKTPNFSPPSPPLAGEKGAGGLRGCYHLPRDDFRLLCESLVQPEYRRAADGNSPVLRCWDYPAICHKTEMHPKRVCGAAKPPRKLSPTPVAGSLPPTSGGIRYSTTPSPPASVRPGNRDGRCE